MAFQMKSEKIGALDAVRIITDDAEALLTPHGAHVLSFRPFVGEGEDVLWGSEKSNYEDGKAIRGGIPVCWPWFGKVNMPAHGFARLTRWNMDRPTEEADGSVTVILTYQNQEYGLAARVTVNVGKALTVTLDTENISDHAIPLTDALHTYFHVADVTKIRVSGFDGCDYYCNLAKTMNRQNGDIIFNREIDSIYSAGSRKAVIDDPVLDRRILVERFGSNTAVVWNPWIEKSAKMEDFGDEEYKNMLCVEAVNTREDARTLAPGAKHTLATRISLL